MGEIIFGGLLEKVKYCDWWIVIWQLPVHDELAMSSLLPYQFSPFNFDGNVIATHDTMYQRDSSLNLSFDACQQEQVKFWCELYDGENYKKLSSHAFLLLLIAPTSVIYEHGLAV